MSQINFNVVILAAGNNRRMLSDIPKIMHQIAGKTMLQHLVDSVNHLDIHAIYIIYNRNHEKLIKTINLKNKNILIYWVSQDTPKGTGHAVQQVLPMLADNTEILVLYGDVPLVSYKTLKKLQYIKSQCDISLLTANLPNPKGYGRIIRNQNNDVINIIEDADIFNTQYSKIKEINSGIFITIVKNLKRWLQQITYKNNYKNELYLTDIINLAYQENYQIKTIQPINLFEVIGINNKLDLIQAERIFQAEQAKNLLKLGLIISDPNRFDLRGTLVYGRDVYIDINVIIEGHVSLGNRVRIGANCILKNVVVGHDVIIHPFSIIENSKINFKSNIGPFARLRPGTRLKENTCIGNFVELKNIHLGKGTAVKHLSYLGDSNIGSQVNIGAGVIICNYDGVKKSHTYIKNNAMIGANSELIAPITIGSHAIIGAGTTVTSDVVDKSTVISRIRQFSIPNKKHFRNK